jgi:hypothetical protein
VRETSHEKNAFVRVCAGNSRVNGGRSNYQNDEASDATFSVFCGKEKSSVKLRLQEEEKKRGRGEVFAFFSKKKEDRKKNLKNQSCCCCCLSIFQVFFLSRKY